MPHCRLSLRESRLDSHPSPGDPPNTASEPGPVFEGLHPQSPSLETMEHPGAQRVGAVAVGNGVRDPLGRPCAGLRLPRIAPRVGTTGRKMARFPRVRGVRTSRVPVLPTEVPTRAAPAAPGRSSPALSFSRSARSPTSQDSIGTLTGAGNYPLMHPVLELRRLHEDGEGVEDCRFAARAIFDTFVQPSRAASIPCDHSLRPPQPPEPQEPARPPFGEPIPIPKTPVKHAPSVVGRWDDSRRGLGSAPAEFPDGVQRGVSIRRRPVIGGTFSLGRNWPLFRPGDVTTRTRATEAPTGPHGNLPGAGGFVRRRPRPPVANGTLCAIQRRDFGRLNPWAASDRGPRIGAYAWTELSRSNRLPPSGLGRCLRPGLAREQHLAIRSSSQGQSPRPGCGTWSRAECSTGRVRPRPGLASPRFDAGPNRIRAQVPSVTQKRAFWNHAQK
jgi:hypothetical protein